MRVPILYLRTTLGAGHDWTFDPDWNVERRCGERRIAEDSLSAVIDYSIAHKLPVLFTLNGGIWADAACDVPDWDVNDHLEADKANCQWNEKGEVMPDDYLKNLAGASDSPELARSLTFNVYAAQNRHYKKRNLQAAGRLVAAFANAHPDLFAGVNLDPDTYMNPFFGETQWYDYNPGTLRQFRHWLAGTGPYAGKGGPDVPDLSRYRRAHPLTLAEVRKLAGKSFATWEKVDPPRTFAREGKPFWEDPWMHEWEVFRRHLVHLHYDDMAQWLADTGVPTARIFSAQGFIAPHEPAFPFALRLDSPTKNYDSGGMSVEGAIPRDGHLGAIVYGASALNDIRVEGDANLFATFHQMDPGWAVVEFNTADFRTAGELPTYAMGYRSLREMFNYGARFASPMAWNGSNGIYAGQPGYVSFMAWRNTPLEEAMRDFAVSHAYVPLGARLWTFGSAKLCRFRRMDGRKWHDAAAGQRIHRRRSIADPRHLVVADSAGHRSRRHRPAGARHRWRRPSDRRRRQDHCRRLGRARRADRNIADLVHTPAGVSIPLVWPTAMRTADQVRVSIVTSGSANPLRVRHIALSPARRRSLRPFASPSVATSARVAGALARIRFRPFYVTRATAM